MTLEVSINISSLQVISEELNSTLSQSVSDFEAYLADTQDIDYLESSQKKIAQIGGIFRLLEYPGAALLADEMAMLVAAMANGEYNITTNMVEALTDCYFVLPRYIEYVTLKKSELPILIIPYVNRLRVCCNEPLLPEYYFFDGELPIECSFIINGYCQMDELLSNVVRLRHMYQVGFLGVITNSDSKFHYGLMARAVTRITALLGNHDCAEVWQLSDAVLECFAAGRLSITLNRKRTLAKIEKMMRLMVSQGEQGLENLDTEFLKKDLVFMLMLADYSSDVVDEIREMFSVPLLGMSDNDIVAQREIMQGPSLETIESVVKVLKEELRNAKDILEIASQNNSIEDEDLSVLEDVISRVADTLSILNLQGPRETLTEQLQRMQDWGDDLMVVNRSDFLETADALLYVESALAGLDRRELTVADLNEASEVARKKVIASSQLAEAQAAVIAESQAGVAMAKRAITSYVDSNFDIAHVSNVATTLKTVRGGLHMLNYNRAAAVLNSCSEFMDNHIKESDPSSQRHQLLETLADALISLEYYLIEIAANGEGNEQILEVAEESLDALGYSVS